MTARERLLNIYYEVERVASDLDPDGPTLDAIADLLYEHGVRPPARTVTTVEELDALPVGSVVRSEVAGSATTAERAANWWAITGSRVDHTSASLLADGEPWTVLWEPTP